ncbi:unnamed protein product [Calypogeia fissa]
MLVRADCYLSAYVAGLSKYALQPPWSLYSSAAPHIWLLQKTDGFFCLIDRGISSSSIDKIFATSESFFSLPDSTKTNVQFDAIKNAGWEKKSQIRPSTGVADQKESYQMQFGSNMDSMWLSDSDLPGFKETSLVFMKQAKRYWDFITLLFQKGGQSGPEICPGREVVTSFGAGDTWTKVEPVEGEIVCNIGDLLMSWSDDQFKSTLHRVKTPSDPEVDYFGPRYSIGYFNHPFMDCKIQGQMKKYPVVTGEEFTRKAKQETMKIPSVNGGGATVQVGA